MDLQRITQELRFSLEHIISEEELNHAIIERLTSLRQSFSSHRSLFTPEHIEFLKNLAAISGQLQSFIEMKDELADVDTLEDYEVIVNRLVDIKRRLGPCAVRVRVMKEIRELNEKLPAIREQDGAKRQIRVNTRIADLEQNAPHCLHHHAMAIRNGRYGHFWGCSQYPFCQRVAQLAPEQKNRLFS